MRYDAEIVIADTVKAFLENLISPENQSISPIVTFFDPMSIDDANRIIVMVPDIATDAASPGNFAASVEVVTKTLWKQETIADDFKNHFERVNDVRDKLMAPDLIDRLTALLPTGVKLEYVQPRRQFSTSIRTDNWIRSDAQFTLQGYFSPGL